MNNLVLEMIAVGTILLSAIVFTIIFRIKLKKDSFAIKFSTACVIVLLSIFLIMFEGIWLCLLLGVPVL